MQKQMEAKERRRKVDEGNKAKREERKKEKEKERQKTKKVSPTSSEPINLIETWQGA